MPHYKDSNNKLHFLDDVSYIYLLPSDCVEITDEEAEAIRLASIPQPTLADLAENVRQALQSAIDAKAKSFGFSNGNALMLYAGFNNAFRTLAESFATWEASIWVEAGQYKLEVIQGTKPMLTPEEAVAMMPTYP